MIGMTSIPPPSSSKKKKSSSSTKSTPSSILSGYSPLHREGYLAFVHFFFNTLSNLEKQGRFEHRDLLISRFLSRLSVEELRNLIDFYGLVNPTIATLVQTHKRKYEPEEEASPYNVSKERERLRQLVLSQPFVTKFARDDGIEMKEKLHAFNDVHPEDDKEEQKLEIWEQGNEEEAKKRKQC